MLFVFIAWRSNLALRGDDPSHHTPPKSATEKSKKSLALELQSLRHLMYCQSIDSLASVFTAIGTVAVAILAIWGDQVKDYFLGPRLTLSLVSESGDLTKRVNGAKVYYYHLRVANGKRRLPARGVRVVVQGISKRAPSGAFVQQPLVYPLQLVWTPMEPGEVERTIVQNSTCDLGFL